MSFEVCLNNTFAEFSPEVPTFLLGETFQEISEIFQNELQCYTSKKLEKLLSMKNDIFNDSTVYTGSAGIALYCFLCSMSEDEVDFDLLKESLNYLNLNNLKGRKISFLCGDAGPLALATVIAYKLGNQVPPNLPDYKVWKERLISLISLLEDSPDEILYGKSGYLFALLFVNKYVRDLIPPDHIEKVVKSILKSGKKFSAQMKSDSPLLWQWHEKIYFGAAHGLSGILFILLQARSYVSDAEIHMSIKPTIDWLLKHQFKSGNFPSSFKSSSGDKLVQWCHGAPGFVSLYTLAYQVFDEDKYLKTALKCGEVTWQRGLSKKGYSICHGVSGNAYAFLELFQTTKEAVHLYRACCFAKWCMEERPGSEQRPPDRPASLFEGLAGPLHLAKDIQRPLQAKFPAFAL